jgi:hypothetical protein
MSTFTFPHRILLPRQLVVDGMPSEFVIPNSQVLEGKYFGVGIQNYLCNGTEFRLESANAELWSNPELTGTSTGKHYFTVTTDGVGTAIHFEVNGTILRTKVVRVVNATNPVHDIPLALFQKTGPEGQVGLAEYVAQLNTKHGVPMRHECSMNQRMQVPFTADYWFFAPQTNSITKNNFVTADTGAYPSVRPQVNSSPTITFKVALGIFLIVILSKF